MSPREEDMPQCEVCGQEFPQEEIYTLAGRALCEACAVKAELYPLGHTGMRRDRISEKGRQLTRPTAG